MTLKEAPNVFKLEAVILTRMGGIGSDMTS